MMAVAPSPSSALDLRVLAQQGSVHFIGVAGAGMSALAEALHGIGGRVTGCDVRPGGAGATLQERGIPVYDGHDPAHVTDAVAVVVTAAIPPDHPELQIARERGIPVFKRAQALGQLVSRGTVLAVAGTHGKTTTTAMLATILVEAGLDPTAFVGGAMPSWGGGLRAGADRIFVVEADEYDRSFLSLTPAIVVLTSVEADHLDIFGGLAGVEGAFREFLGRVTTGGLVVACADDAGVRRVLDGVREPEVLWYGLSGGAGLRATRIVTEGRAVRFQLEETGRDLGAVQLGVPGVHNVRNALGAIAAARRMGADVAAAGRALTAFRGVGRRFQEEGRARDILLIDDYAHHPTEIRATLAAARATYPGRRVVAVFQPHLYSRTRDFADDFGAALAGADAVWVTDVYPARELPVPGVDGMLVVGAVRRVGAPGEVHYVPALEDLPAALATGLRPGDVCVLMGAGDIDGVSPILLARLTRGGNDA